MNDNSNNNNLGYSSYNNYDNVNYNEKKGNGLKIIIVLFVILAIILIVIFALRKKESIELTLYVGETKVSNLDKKERYKMRNYTCTNDSKVSFDENTNQISVETDIQASCNIYFDIIKVQELCANASLADCLINNYEILGLTKINHSPTGNQKYSTTEYRFQGNNVNNYIRFNGDRLWRILGVFEVETPTSSGTYRKEYKVKILSNTVIYEKFADSTHTNNWNIARLKVLLNDGLYYYPENNESCTFDECDYDDKGLIETSKQYISKTKWYLGNVNNEISAEEMYEEERSNNVWEGGIQTWDGNVGLIYPSDYMFASSECYNDASKYGSSSSKINSYKDDTCIDSNWLSNGDAFWTISPYATYRSSVVSVFGEGIVDDADAFDYSIQVKPTLYLKTSTSYQEGFGTKNNPYVIR